MKTKTFDCVEMKRRGAERVQKELAGLTPQQQLEYWRQQTDQLRKQGSAANLSVPHPSTRT